MANGRQRQYLEGVDEKHVRSQRRKDNFIVGESQADYLSEEVTPKETTERLIRGSPDDAFIKKE